MSEENLDLVDENDNVIGTVNRMDAHYEGLRHRTVVVLIFNKKGELLLQKRSALKGTMPYSWALSVGGHVDAGEAYIDAARREMKEEMGIECEFFEIGKIYQHMLYKNRRKDSSFITVYCCEYEGPFNIQREEVTALKFFPQKDIELLVAENPDIVMPIVSNVLKFFYNIGEIRGEAKVIEKIKQE